MTILLPSKDPEESVPIPFGFAKEMLTGETISSCTVVASVASGVDPTPAAILSGAPEISGGQVLQLVTGGVDGVDYLLRAKATLSSSRVLVRQARLPISR